MAKTALCIGINDYPGTQSDLSGCVNDMDDWAKELDRRGFQVTRLRDKQATKEAMVGEIEKLVRTGNPGDTIVLTYSGHGSWIPDSSGDEPDRRDECLCPYDIGQNRPLLDDELYDLFSLRAAGTKILFISDSCHSGTVTRAAPPFDGDDTPRRVRFLPPDRFLRGDELAAATRLAHPRLTSRPRHASLLLAGCQDFEYSYDASFQGRPNGAFTYVALQALAKVAKDATYGQWFRSIRASLPSTSYPQTPNLFGSSGQKAWRVFG